MAGRPRESAKVLELRGAFKAHPERQREDLPGAGPFAVEPPTHLSADLVPAWRYIVERLPMVALTSSEEIAVEQASRCLCGVWELDKMGSMGRQSQEFKRLNDSLLQWLIQLGMTLQARTKIGTNGTPKGNKFGKFKDSPDQK